MGFGGFACAEEFCVSHAGEVDDLVCGCFCGDLFEFGEVDDAGVACFALA